MSHLARGKLVQKLVLFVKYEEFHCNIRYSITNAFLRRIQEKQWSAFDGTSPICLNQFYFFTLNSNSIFDGKTFFFSVRIMNLRGEENHT